jgi:hypothetical protein
MVPRQHTFTKMPAVQGDVPRVAIDPSTHVPPSGRGMQAELKKMTDNQKKWQIAALLDKHDFHPIEEMIVMAKTGECNGAAITTDQKIKICAELAQYVQPKLKTVENQGTGVDNSVNITIMRFDSRPEAIEKVVQDAVKTLDVPTEVVQETRS